MRVIVLHEKVAEDARPDEMDVLVQAGAVAAALRRLGHEVSLLEVTLDLDAARHSLAVRRPDVVFNLVESFAGLGRLQQFAAALLEALAIPFTGCGSEAMQLSNDKLAAKRLLASAGIATPAWVSDDPRDADVGFRPGRCIIKLAFEHASLGLDENAIVGVADRQQLVCAIAERGSRSKGSIFAEQFIDGREFNISLVGSRAAPRLLPPAEIDFVGYGPDQPRIVGYHAKWSPDSFEFNNTPRRFDFGPEDRQLLVELSDIAIRCWRLFALSGYARVDFRVDAAGRPWVLEINANPCISPDAGFPAAAQQAGLSFDALVELILSEAGT